MWYVSISGGRRSTDHFRHHATGHCPCSQGNALERKMRLHVHLLLSRVLTNDTALLNVIPVFFLVLLLLLPLGRSYLGGRVSDHMLTRFVNYVLIP